MHLVIAPAGVPELWQPAGGELHNPAGECAGLQWPAAPDGNLPLGQLCSEHQHDCLAGNGGRLWTV